jgi:hypothetical protein
MRETRRVFVHKGEIHRLGGYQHEVTEALSDCRDACPAIARPAMRH